jgi:hypothetical protein
VSGIREIKGQICGRPPKKSARSQLNRALLSTTYFFFFFFFFVVLAIAAPLPVEDGTASQRSGR